MIRRSIKTNVLYSVINQGSNILFQLITIKYVSNILHTENYGKVNFCYSILSYFLLLAQLGISSYAIREGSGIRDDKEKLIKFSKEMFSINIVSTILAIVLYSLTICFFVRLNSNLAIMMALGLQLILNVFNVEWINSIYEDFKYIAIRNVLIQVLSLGLMIAFVKNEHDCVIYALVLSISTSLNYLINFMHCKKTINIGVTMHLNLKKHIVPILLLFFNALTVLIYVNSDITIVGIIKGDADVGVYSVAVKVYTVVKKIIQAIIIVAIPRLSFLLSSEKITEYKILLKKMHDIIVTIVIPMLIGLIMMSHNAIAIDSGSEYLKGITSLRILCIALVFSSLANYYISCVLLPNKKERIILISSLISSIVNIALNIVFIPFIGIIGAAITTTIAELIVMVLAFINSKEYRQHKDCISILFKILFGCLGIITVCIVIDGFDLPFVFDTVLKVALSAVFYLIIEIIVRNPVICKQRK